MARASRTASDHTFAPWRSAATARWERGGRRRAGRGEERATFAGSEDTPQGRITGPRRHRRASGRCAVQSGGATGAGVAVDAASRGLKVALVERSDFSSGACASVLVLARAGAPAVAGRDRRSVRHAPEPTAGDASTSASPKRLRLRGRSGTWKADPEGAAGVLYSSTSEPRPKRNKGSARTSPQPPPAQMNLEERPSKVSQV